MKWSSTLIVLVIAGLPGVAAAQTPDTASTPRIDKRQQNQEKRIEKGAQTGQLTDKEKARLDKGQARVQKAEDKAMADGKMTKKERAHIEHMQDKQSKHIYKEKHDKQVAK